MLESNLLIWLFILGLGFPILNVVLHEATEHFARKQHPLAIALRRVRQYVLLPLVLLLVMRILFRIASTEPSTRILETLTWVAVVVAAISLLNAFLTTKKTSIPRQIQVPNLLFQTIRGGVILLILYRVGGIWQIDLSGLAAALGVGSLVVALALQDTFSNLVSGLLLLIASPFKEGDWIEVNGMQGRVIDQNWWSVTLEHAGKGIRTTIPNGQLSKATIQSYYQGGGVWKKIYVSFSYDDSPNEVVNALSTIGKGVRGRLTCPELEIYIDSFGESGVNYKIGYQKQAVGGNIAVLNALMSEIYFLAKRHNFTITYPINVQYTFDAKFDANDRIPNKLANPTDNRLQEMADFLRSLTYLSSLEDTKINELATKAKFEVYGSGEFIIEQGINDEGLYFVYTGKVGILTKTRQRDEHEVNSLKRGSVFGELAVFPGEVSPITAVAKQDVEVVVIPDEDVMELIESNLKFSLEFSQFIEQRRKAMAAIQAIGSKS